MERWKKWYTVQRSEEQSENPTEDEVWEIIRTLKNSKSPGEGIISAELIKYGDKKLREEIHALIEVIWTLEKVPENWQTAIICPKHKKGDKLQCSNYRGISLLNLSYKVLTIILHRWLFPYTEEILGDYQCGFRKGQSATDNLLMV